jgi:hypothetical protein
MSDADHADDQTPYLYVLVRRDLSPAQQTVQAIHAALEFSRHYPPTSVHPHLVVLGVPGDDALLGTRRSLHEARIGCIGWREPDLNNALTAIAAGPVYGRQRQHFRHYQLLKEK